MSSSVWTLARAPGAVRGTQAVESLVDSLRTLRVGGEGEVDRDSGIPVDERYHAPHSISPAGEQIVGLDVRPANKQVAGCFGAA